MVAIIDEKQAEGEELRPPMHFLDRLDLWETTKPYSIDFYLEDEEFPRSNYQHSAFYPQVQNMRMCDPPVSLDTNGFAIHHLDTKMHYSDFADKPKIESIYLAELERYFESALNAKHVRSLDFQVRRTAPEYPYFGGKLPGQAQPALLAHVDVTPASIKSIIDSIFPDCAERIKQSRYQVITVWRPLRLPFNDWPLAICDARSVDHKDLVAADVIHTEHVAENFQVHFNEKQQWFWLPDHKANEVLVFKAHDTENNGSSPCPHVSFPYHHTGSEYPARESIDVRMLVMYADIDY